MSASVDIHAQLAAIIERFAKSALMEMSRAVEQEVTRRKMEVETLLVKLQFTENELRAARLSQARSRSVGIQVSPDRSREVKLQQSPQGAAPHHEDASGALQVQDAAIRPVEIKEEHMEEQEWDDESPPFCPVEEQEGFSAGAAGGALTLSSKALKESGLWSPGLPEEFSFSSAPLEASPLQPLDPNAPLHHPPPQDPFRAPEAPQRPREPQPERSSQCPQCGKSFTTRFYLKIHQRIHTGERPYTCPQCGRGFYCNSHLISHQRCHTGEKPYSCDECGKSYSHLNSLKLHQRSHAEDEAYAYW